MQSLDRSLFSLLPAAKENKKLNKRFPSVGAPAIGRLEDKGAARRKG